MADSTMRIGFDENTVDTLGAFADQIEKAGNKIEKALKALAAVETFTTEPTEPGFYAYTGGRQTMVFLLDHHGQWHVTFDNGDGNHCEWGYIEQCLSVYELVRIDALMGGF